MQRIAARVGLTVLMLVLVACGSDRALEEQRRSFEGQVSSLQDRVSSLEAERENLQEALGTGLEEEYSFVVARIGDLQTQLDALQTRRDELRAELEAAGVRVPPQEDGQTGGAEALTEMLNTLSGGAQESTGGSLDVTGGLLESDSGRDLNRGEGSEAASTGGEN